MKKLFGFCVLCLVVGLVVGCQEERGTSASFAEEDAFGNGEPNGSDECIPDCSYRECGDDGCGGVCGEANGLCPDGQICNAVDGQCVTGGTKPDDDVVEPPEPTVCQPNCANKECDDDGCGGSCGKCGANMECKDNWECKPKEAGAPPCVPNCLNKECGNDTCGGSCGLCGDGLTCTGWECEPVSVDCEPNCTNKDCGPDGCGGSCGKCGEDKACNNNDECVPEDQEPVCQPNCTNKECGGDGCGGSCGICTNSEVCSNGQCVCVPQCTGKTCGSDGCGGSCGACAGTCQAGQCVAPPAWTGQIVQFQMVGTIWITGTEGGMSVNGYGAWNFGAPDKNPATGYVDMFVEVTGVDAPPMNGQIFSDKPFMPVFDGGSPIPPACGTAPQVLTLGLPWEDPWQVQDYWVRLGCK